MLQIIKVVNKVPIRLMATIVTDVKVSEPNSTTSTPTIATETNPRLNDSMSSNTNPLQGYQQVDYAKIFQTILCMFYGKK